MTTYKIILYLSIILFLTKCNGQSKETQNLNNTAIDTTKQFVIGNYMIVPSLKEVRKYSIFGEKEKGFNYEKDPKINYQNTTLLALGDKIFFKEYFDFDFNLDKLKAIHKDKFYFLSKDDKNIYYTSNGLLSTKIDISEYEAVNDFIYKSKKGAFFFLDIEQDELQPIEISFDEHSIKHIIANYYYDKNGLYFFGNHYKKNAKGYYDNFIDKSEKLIAVKNKVPIVSEKYFTFNNQVFALDGDKINVLDIDANKIIEVDIQASGSFITDGKTIYNSSNYGYDEKNGKGYYGIWYPVLYSGINIQKIYSPFLNFRKENNTIVFNKKYSSDFMGLVATFNNENYFLTDKKKFKLEKMLFYHPETKTTDIFDEKYLKMFKAERFIQYKNVLYFDGIPVETTKLDMENLKEIENSNYLTDGKSIIYIGHITGYSNIVKNNVGYAVFDERILENSYTKEIRAINADLLYDHISLISKNQKIKVKDLKLKVKIVE